MHIETFLIIDFSQIVGTNDFWQLIKNAISSNSCFWYISFFLKVLLLLFSNKKIENKFAKYVRPFFLATFPIFLQRNIHILLKVFAIIELYTYTYIFNTIIPFAVLYKIKIFLYEFSVKTCVTNNTTHHLRRLKINIHIQLSQKNVTQWIDNKIKQLYGLLKYYKHF
jgi:hypothetical protein